MSDSKGPSSLKPLTQAKKDFLKVYNGFVTEHNITQAQMAKMLGVNLSTLRDTIDAQSPNLNANIVIAFCMKFKILDIETVYAKDVKEPEYLKEEVASKTNFTIFRHSHDCHVLNDEAFMGTFYGYCRNTLYNNLIDDFTLAIYRDSNGTVQAKLALTNHTLRSEKLVKTLYGKPMHLEPDIIYIILQSDDGDDMFILSYSWFQIRLGGSLYCRYGSLLTPCRETKRYPQMQAFVILDNPISAEKMHYVDGFLRLSQDKIIVPASKFDAEAGGLMATDETVQFFFEQCSDLQYNAEPYYCFSEKVLLAMGYAKDMDFDITAATIMTLKENSINPKVIDFPNNKTYSKFLQKLCAPNNKTE